MLTYTHSHAHKYIPHTSRHHSLYKHHAHTSTFGKSLHKLSNTSALTDTYTDTLAEALRHLSKHVSVHTRIIVLYSFGGLLQ